MVFRWLRRPEAERAEEYRKAASLRGWRLDLTDTHFNYSGTTGGIPWTFTAHRHLRRGEVRWPSRWETAAVKTNELIVVYGREADKALRVDIPDFVRNLALRPLATRLGLDVQTLANARQEPSLRDAIAEIDAVAAVLSPEGIRIVMPIVIQAPDAIETVVRAGVGLAGEVLES